MTVSNGGNPNGSSMSLDRRRKLIEIADIYDLLIIEDDPYYFLQFEEPVESIFSLDWNSSSPSRRTIRSDSLSKVVSAGIRVGWITGPTEVISKVELHTQVCDKKSLSPFYYVIILGVDNALSSTGPSNLLRTFENLGPKRIRKSRGPSTKLL